MLFYIISENIFRKRTGAANGVFHVRAGRTRSEAAGAREMRRPELANATARHGVPGGAGSNARFSSGKIEEKGFFLVFEP